MKSRLALALPLMALPFGALAQTFDDLARIDLLPGWRTEAGDHVAALQITLRPGWVTYWRAPGDSGIPPQIAFLGDAQIESITPKWPTPEVFGEDGMRSVGYHDGVTVPLDVALVDGSGPVSVSGEITIGVCEEICIPVTVPFSGVLPSTGATNADIAAALSQQPITGDQAGVSAVTCQIAPIDDGLRVTSSIAIPARGIAEHVVIETPDPSIWVSEAKVARRGNTLTATVDMVHPSGGAFALDRGALRITVMGDGPAVDLRGCSAG